jgi:hypothetical protein
MRQLKLTRLRCSLPSPAMSGEIPLALRLPHPDSAFRIAEEFSPVAIAYGSLHVSEHNSSRRLLKELWRLGKRGVRVRGVISSRGALDSRSLAALNVYLLHVYGRKSRVQWVASGVHRHAWYDLQRRIGFRWVR